jgi:hypothetical protein
MIGASVSPMNMRDLAIEAPYQFDITLLLA